MKTPIRILLILLCLVAMGHQGHAQGSSSTRNVVLTLGGGPVSSYFGDLGRSGNLVQGRGNAHLGVEYRFYDRFSVLVNGQYNRIQGADSLSGPSSSHFERNLSFRSDNFSGTVNLLVSLHPGAPHGFSRHTVGLRNFDHTRRYASTGKLGIGINPYASVGIGVVNFNPTAFYNGQWHALRPLQTENVAYGSYAIVMPVGLGAKVKVGPHIDLGVIGTYTFTQTDYLDDVSTVHVAPNSLGSDLARALSDRRPEVGYNIVEAGLRRGNAISNDSYFTFAFTVDYYMFSTMGWGSGGGGGWKRPPGQRGKLFNFNNNRRRRPNKRFRN